VGADSDEHRHATFLIKDISVIPCHIDAPTAGICLIDGMIMKDSIELVDSVYISPLKKLPSDFLGQLPEFLFKALTKKIFRPLIIKVFLHLGNC
jgi:hypothetical protein